MIVGNEGAGIRLQLNEIVAQRAVLARGAESLNVAVAAASCSTRLRGADA